jgi:cobalamin biosynthesis Mg chelatase CobN
VQQPCLNNFLGGGLIADCQAFDAKCICENRDFLAQIACCLVDSCTAEEQKDTVDFAHAMCRTVQVTNLPDEVVCSTATAAGTSATQAASAASSASGSVTQAPAASSDAAADSQTTSQSPNAGPIPTMAPVGILGGLIAAAALL